MKKLYGPNGPPYWSIFLHILKMLAFFLRVNTLRSQLQKMPLNPLIIF